jgi:hypothetical protein
MQERRIKEAIAFAKPYQPDAFLAVGEFVHHASTYGNDD